MKSCFHQLPVFRDVGDRLLAKYDSATSTEFNRHGTTLVTSSSTAVRPTVRRRSSTGDEGSGSQQPRRKWKRGDTGRRPSKENLVYFERSPDYCETTSDGLALPESDGGTHGRQCRRSASGIPRTETFENPGRFSLAAAADSSTGSSAAAPDSCDVLCCGRGYNSYREVVVERCRCRFVWCCHVTCSTCEREENVYVCK